VHNLGAVREVLLLFEVNLVNIISFRFGFSNHNKACLVLGSLACYFDNSKPRGL
jgi:hypothetical protein